MNTSAYISNVSSETEFEHRPTPNSSTEDYSSFSETTEYKLGIILVTYFLPVIIVSGTIGNVTSFVVLLRKRMRSVTVYLYLTVLACADTSVLYLSAFKTWLRLLTGIEILHVSEAGCKVVMLLFLFGLYMSAWLIVLITVDRCIVVWLPFKAAIICTRKRAVISLLVLSSTVLLYNLHVLWTLDLNSPSSDSGLTQQCAPWSDNYFMTRVFPYLNLASYSLAPFTIVLSLNLAIIWKVLRSGTSGSDVNRCTSYGEHTRRLHTQVRTTYMLLSVTFVWLFLTGPFTIWTLVSTSGADSHSMGINFLTKTICFLLMYINHSVNFYLYCFNGKKFRQELFSCLWCNRKKPNDPFLGSGISSRTATRKRNAEKNKENCAERCAGNDEQLRLNDIRENN